MATTNISNLYNTTDKWGIPAPDYVTLLGHVGSATTANRADCTRTIINLSARSPITLAFVIAGDADHIHVGHSPSMFAGDPTDVTPFDDLMVLLVGDDLTTSVLVVLLANAFGCTGNVRCLEIANILGPAGHTAILPIYHSGPHGAGIANTSEINLCHSLLLPSDTTHLFLSTILTGCYTLTGFYNTFIQPGLASPVPAVVAATEPIRDWFQGASTDVVAGDTVVASAPVTTRTPMIQQCLNTWVARVKERQLARVGVGGLGLTTTAFDVGARTPWT